MFSALQTFGTAMLPTILEGAVQLGKNFISQHVGDVQDYGIKKTLGSCTEGLADTLANKLQLSPERRRAARTIINAFKQSKRSQQMQREDQYETMTGNMFNQPQQQQQQYQAPRRRKNRPREYEADDY